MSGKTETIGDFSSLFKTQGIPGTLKRSIDAEKTPGSLPSGYRITLLSSEGSMLSQWVPLPAKGKYSFKDKNSDKKYTIRLTWGRDKRIVGMGPYYRDYDVLAGDRVLLEKNIQSNGEFNYYISFQRSIDTAYFQKVKNHFEALDSDKASAFVGMQFLSADGDSVKIEYYGEIQKRKDSPIMTKVYDVIVENQNIQGNYQDRDMIALKLQDGKIQIKDVQPWAKYVIEVKK
jgi:hypothetical protein